MRTRRFSVAAIVLGVLLASVGTSQAEERFTRRSLNGTYGFSGAGTLGGLPAAVVGLNRFDGRGNCQISARLNSAFPTLLGVVALASLTCTYTVNLDGTGVLDVTFLIGAFRSDFVIVNDELHFVLSDPFMPGNVIASGVSKLRNGQDN